MRALITSAQRLLGWWGGGVAGATLKVIGDTPAEPRMPTLAPQVCEETVEIQFHTVTSAPHSQETDSEKLMAPSGIADAPVLTRIDYRGRETNGMTVLEQLRGKVGHYGAGESSPRLLMAACSRQFCEALRGLQVVCYAGSLGNGDKAARAFQVHTLAASQGEAGSRAQFSGTGGIDTLCHGLFCSDN